MTAGILKVFLVAITVVLLSSPGGAGVVAAPLLLPLQFLAAWTSRGMPELLVWTLFAAATASEAIWAMTYLAFGEAMPWIWFLPALAAMSVGTAVFLGARVARRRRGASS